MKNMSSLRKYDSLLIPLASYVALGVATVFLLPTGLQEFLANLITLPTVERLSHHPIGANVLGSYFNVMTLSIPIFWIWISFCDRRRTSEALRRSGAGRLIALTILMSFLAAPTGVYAVLWDGGAYFLRPGSLDRILIRAASNEIRLTLYGSFVMSVLLIGSWVSWVAVPSAWLKRWHFLVQ